MPRAHQHSSVEVLHLRLQPRASSVEPAGSEHEVRDDYVGKEEPDEHQARAMHHGLYLRRWRQ